MTLPPVVGITVANPPYESLAREAMASFRRATGCPAILLTVDDEASYAAKFTLPDILGNRVGVFFDADVRWFGPADLSRFANMEGIAGVKDASRHAPDSFCLPDAITLGFPAEQYLNTGVLAIGKGSAVREAFQMAARMHERRAAGYGEPIQDMTEQSLLNAALHLCRVPLQFLPDEWNFWPHAIQRGWAAWPAGKIGEACPVKCIHAAGVGLSKKKAFLDRHEAVFGLKS